MDATEAEDKTTGCVASGEPIARRIEVQTLSPGETLLLAKLEALDVKVNEIRHVSNHIHLVHFAADHEVEEKPSLARTALRIGLYCLGAYVCIRGVRYFLNPSV